MSLDRNGIPPIFKLTDVFGNHIDLNEYIDKKVFIGFFRHTGCPFCNLRIQTLKKLYENIKNDNFEMIFFFESSEEAIQKSKFHKDISPIPVIADPDKKWYNAYGIETSFYKSAISHLTSFIPTAIKARKNELPVHTMPNGESLNTIPAEFLVNRNLKINNFHYSQRLNDRMDVRTIKAFAGNGR